MNCATRATLAVLFIVAIADSPVLADVASDYETLFGAEDKKVAASRSKIDDAAFAAKLLKSAMKMPDSPGIQVLLYEKACKFGSSGPAGCDTALEALGLLEKAVPGKKDQWRRRKFEVVKLRFDKSYGTARKAAGQPYMEMLEALADANAVEGKGTEAKKLYSRAIMVAKYIKSNRAATILAKSKRANAVVAQQAKLKSLQARLTADPKDTAVRKELILLYVVGLDNPAEAGKLLSDDLDEVTRTYVPLAAIELDDLNEAICMELGDWYYRTLLKHASEAGKPVVLRRAQGYYQQFLDAHTKRDTRSFRVETALESIEKELKKLGAPAVRSTVRPGSKTIILDLAKGVTMKLVRIPAGKFMMGSPAKKKDQRENETPQRRVTISRSFYMGVTEVTQTQYESVTGKNPSKIKGPQNAVVKVSWDDATAFCTVLSKKTRRAVRLPTEAQWEYACRAGAKTRFSFGDDDKDLGAYAWYKNRGGAAPPPHPVGRKKPNAFGLYDMHGGVWEWCRDYYDDKFYTKAKNVDPENTKAPDGGAHVVRGGSWIDGSGNCRAAARSGCSSIMRFYSLGSGGFRVVVVSGSAVK